jgi:ankyrin repeat protein
MDLVRPILSVNGVFYCILYKYAARNWGHHARAAMAYQHIISFLEMQAQVEAAVQALFAHKRFFQRYPKEMTGLHLAAYFGLEEALQKLWCTCGIDIDERNGRTPLSYSAENGHEAVVKLLLENGASVNIADSRGWTPIIHAIQFGHEAVAELLQSW